MSELENRLRAVEIAVAQTKVEVRRLSEVVDALARQVETLSRQETARAAVESARLSRAERLYAFISISIAVGAFLSDALWRLL